MFLKLGVIGIILVVGGIIFSSQIQEIFPNTSTDGIDSLKADVNIMATKSFESAEQKIESSVKQTEKLSEIGHQTIKKTEDAVESSLEQADSKLSEFKENSSEYVEENITNKIPFLDSDE